MFWYQINDKAVLGWSLFQVKSNCQKLTFLINSDTWPKSTKQTTSSLLHRFQLLQSRNNLVLYGPISNLLRQLKSHLIKLDRHILMSQMLMFNSNVIVSQHSHMLDFPLIFLRQSIAKSFLITLQIIQTSFNRLNSFLMQIKMRKNNTFVDVSRSYRFVSFLEVFVNQTLLYLQSHL